MAKGFKDDNGNFRPTQNTAKLSSRDVQQTETISETKIMSNADIIKAQKELIIKQEANVKNDIGLTKDIVQFRFGFVNGSLGTDEQRQIGNQLIEQVVNMTKKNNPKVKDWKIHSEHVYNEYNDVQRAIALAKPHIEKLIEQRNDGDPTTWKWKSPIILDDGKENSMNFFVTDGQNGSWLTDAYKGKMAITLMSPQEFLKLANEKVARTGERKDLRGDEFTKNNIDELTSAMMKGEPIDTVYLTIDNKLQVFAHEGLHRGLSAIKAGIKEIPVYVYMNGDNFTDKQIEDVTSNPTLHLRPDTR